MHGSIPGHTCRAQVTYTDLVAYAYGGGRTDSEHDHIRQVGHVLGNLMSGLRRSAEPSDHDGRESESQHFEQHVRRNGSAYFHEFPQAFPIEQFPPEGAKTVPPHVTHPHGDNKQERHRQTRDQCGDTGPQDSKLGESPFSEDKQIVEDNVNHV